jgi:hypothetical protein
MNRTVFAIMIACVVAVSGISAQETSRTHIRADGEGVTADFLSVDTSTCELGIETRVYVHAAQGVVHVDNEPSEENVATVVVSVFDLCLNMPVLSVTGSGAADQLVVNPALKSASLRTSIQGTDDSDNPVAIAVDLVWTAADRAEHTTDHVHYNEFIYHFESTSIGVIRDAVAGGSVVVGAVDVTPLPSVEGVIEKNASRTLDVWR